MQEDTDYTPKTNEEVIHHANDKSFKTIMKVKETAIEYVEKFFPELLKHIDISTFELDNTNYITKEFDEYFSDVVYRTRLKSTTKKQDKSVAVALLFEHKKSILSYFLLFIQLLEYIIFIWREDIANKRKPSIIIPIVVFQGKKGLKMKELHDSFKYAPKELLKFIPNFQCHLTNVHELSDKEILDLDEDGLLRSLFLAYTYSEKKDQINNILMETFKFIRNQPERFNFFQLLFDFLAKEDYLSADEVNELFVQYLSPKQEKNMLTTYQVWIQKGKVEGLQEGKQKGEILKAHLMILRGRWKGASADFLADQSELPFTAVEKLLIGYDKTYELWQKKKTGKKHIAQIEHLSEHEVQYLIDLFNKNQN